MSHFNFALHHRPGQSMGKADVLSRRSDNGSGVGDNENVTLLFPELFAIWALKGVTAVGEENTFRTSEGNSALQAPRSLWPRQLPSFTNGM